MVISSPGAYRETQLIIGWDTYIRTTLGSNRRCWVVARVYFPSPDSTLAAVKDFFRKSYPPPNYVSLHLFQLHPEEDASQLLPLTTSSTSWTPSASTSSAWLEKPPPRMSWMGSMGWGTRSCLMSMLLSQGGGKLTLSSTCTAPSWRNGMLPGMAAVRSSCLQPPGQPGQCLQSQV